MEGTPPPNGRHDGVDLLGAHHARAERVGPYLVLRELASGGGARFVEAEGPDGARVLLQAVRLRAVSDEADRVARQRYERALGAKTAALFDEVELEIRAQGGADTHEGARWTFWAVKQGGTPLSPDGTDVAAVSRAILDRMVTRHSRGRVDPLLSEHTLWKHADGKISVAGVPVAVDPTWLASGQEPPRRAPDEPTDGDTKSDLWRLGQALEALIRRGAAAPPGLSAFVAKLATQKITGAADALEQLAVVARANKDAALDAPTARIDFEPTPSTDVSTDPALRSADIATQQTRTRSIPPPQPVLVQSGEVVTVDPSEVNTSTQAYVEVAPTPTIDEPPMDPAAVAWAPALFPEGASPWSEVIRPRAARRPSFTGFVGELPAVDPDDVIEPNALTRNSMAPGPAMIIPVPLPVPAPVQPIGLTPGRRMAIAAGATLLVLGMVALWGRDRPAPIEALEGMVATGSNEVTLESEPRAATVVSEADGRVLGVTPLRFLVPPGAEVVVLLVRSGHDPQRLVLPDRGGLVATLAAVTAAPCKIQIESASGGAVEGVGADIGTGPEHFIPGAAVVRVRSEDAVGARIVRCPEVGPGSPVRLRFGAGPDISTVRITHPAGATASIEGTEVGVVPAQRAVRGAFARVRITESSGAVSERLVPSMGDVEVQMPTASRSEPAPAPSVIETTQVILQPRERTSSGREPRSKADALTLLREGIELLQAGHADSAKTRFQACLKADPTAAACHRGLGEAFRRQDSTLEARLHYARYLELQPDAPDASFVKSLLRQL